ncbi:MAG: hypothetical protein FWC00_02050 [Firmicutes bacterium]|nr:hypothetical protein [Bacillota bacterium]
MEKQKIVKIGASDKMLEALRDHPEVMELVKTATRDKVMSAGWMTKKWKTQRYVRGYKTLTGEKIKPKFSATCRLFSSQPSGAKSVIKGLGKGGIMKDFNEGWLSIPKTEETQPFIDYYKQIESGALKDGFKSYCKIVGTVLKTGIEIGASSGASSSSSSSSSDTSGGSSTSGVSYKKVSIHKSTSGRYYDSNNMEYYPQGNGKYKKANTGEIYEAK